MGTYGAKAMAALYFAAEQVLGKLQLKRRRSRERMARVPQYKPQVEPLENRRLLTV